MLILDWRRPGRVVYIDDKSIFILHDIILIFRYDSF